EAENGIEALELLETRQYKLMMLDQLMPGLSGMQTLEKVAISHPELPVIMVSACVDHDMAKKALILGARECLFKPVNNDKLIHIATKYSTGKGTDLTINAKSLRTNKSKVILVYDNNSIIRDLYRVILSREGFRTVMAETAIEAIRETENRYFDLILTDPGSDSAFSKDVIQRLRINNPYTPIIIASEQLNTTTIENGHKAGACHTINKPLNPARLMAEINGFMSLYDEIPKS
ncbi:MAG: response regulator, partial [Planctomycetes bacterium]|nr:response regulator [Planctomycetota bacterium]